jgi:hypothetical protein
MEHSHTFWDPIDECPNILFLIGEFQVAKTVEIALLMVTIVSNVAEK